MDDNGATAVGRPCVVSWLRSVTRPGRRVSTESNKGSVMVGGRSSRAAETDSGRVGT